MRWKVLVPGRRWWLVPPAVLGIALAGWLVARREPPRREPAAEAVRPVRVIRVAAVGVIPRALGFGSAEPGRVWQAVSEVRGRVIDVHPQLKAGATIEQGEVLLRIDPAEYELAAAQIEADIARVEAQMEELTVQEANDRASLEIENDSLALAEADLDRIESLASRDAASAAERDQQKRAVLAQRQIVQRLTNSLRLVPTQRKTLESELALQQASLGRTRLDVARTVIKAPFDCRLGAVGIQRDQFLAAGQSLFEAHGTAVAEVEAQIPLDQLRTLIDPAHGIQSPVAMDPRTVERLFNFQVIVRYRSGDFLAEWEGRVRRLREEIDPRTRTIGLVVAVENPYEQAIPGQRPPLLLGMFCEVELRAAVQEGRIVIPRSALHGSSVYVVDGERRLRRREVSIAFAQSDFLCLERGLEPGELLVVSDPTPAVDGLRTEPIIDEEVEQRLATRARGEGSVK